MRRKIVTTLPENDKFLDASIPKGYFNIVQRSIGHRKYKKDANALIVDSIRNFLNIHK